MSGTVSFDCPRCGVGLAMSDRQGIEIDYCPQCRGVWLDRGELDKIIERSEAPAAPQQTVPGTPAGGWTQSQSQAPSHQPWGGGYGDRDRDRDHGSYGQGQGYGHGGKRKKSWLGELFD